MWTVTRSSNAAARPKKPYGTIDEPQTARAHGWTRSLVCEPFFHFLVLGLLIWSGVEYWHVQQSRYTIHIGFVERQRITSTYLQQFGQRPTLQQLEGLIDRYVREEIYWREGLALNLDKDDDIVRRRIVQKYEFLGTDVAVVDAPGLAVLQRWFEHNRMRYLAPERVGLSHVYFSPDHDGEQAAKDRALKVLQKLRASSSTRAPDLGDSFPGPSDVGTLTRAEAGRLFGESDLSEKLFEVPVGQWSGPYRSGYGWHLVHVTEQSPPRLPPLTEVQDRVLTDYQSELRRLVNSRAFETLRARYTVRSDGERQ
jgi:hypothetical protein